MTPEELLKEVGEPFGYMIPHYADYPDVFFKHPLPKGYSALMARTKLYTSDQLAAAILKTTKPLEKEVEFQRTAHRRAEEMMLEQGAQLAAEQLNNKLLRDALGKLLDSHEECTDFDGFTAQIVSMDDYHEAQEALSTPFSPTALPELIEKVEKMTIERCAEKLLSIGALGDGDFLAAIRSLPTGQIKLEELL